MTYNFSQTCTISISILTSLSMALAACGGSLDTPPTATSQPSTPPTLAATESSTETSVALAHTIEISPTRLTVPAGMWARYEIVGLPGWDGASAPAWAAGDQAGDVEVTFLTDWGSPAAGMLQIHVKGDALANEQWGSTRTIAITATTPGRTWHARPEIDVVPCEPAFERGIFTRTLGDHGVPRRTGGPTTLTYGIVSAPMQFCEGQAGGRLIVTVTKAATDEGDPLAEPPRFSLYRYLDWPPEITFLGGYISNVEEVALGSQGQLAWRIETGVYVLYFDGRQLIDAAMPVYVPDPGTFPAAAVTYRIEIE